MKRERAPTQEEFGKLLAWLHADTEEAGRKFNFIQARVTKVLSSRGCVDAEALADEVCNRVAVRIDKVVANFTDPVRCFLGFMDHVFHEDLREQQRVAKAIMPERRPSEELEQEDQCLEHCLQRLEQRERQLFVNYFQGEDQSRIDRRKNLAAENGLTMNALRIRAHHLRKAMHDCLMGCLNQT